MRFNDCMGLGKSKLWSEGCLGPQKGSVHCLQILFKISKILTYTKVVLKYDLDVFWTSENVRLIAEAII